MASLNTLEVRGLSRFLNTIYANDLTVNGTFGTSGNMSVGGTLAVTGNTTISGTLTLSKTTDLSGTANNSPALIVGGIATGLHMEIDNNEIQAKNNGTSVATLNLNLDGGLVKIGSGGLEIAGALKATGTTTLGIANITTATVSTGNFTNVNVSNVLRAARYDLQTVGQLGGAFYVSPTVKFPNNATTIKVEKNNTILTITIFDASINADTMAGVAWNIGTKVKASGKLGTVVTGTMDGKVTNINRSSGYMTIVVSGENSGNVVAKNSYAASEISDFYVMAYSIALNDDAETSYPVGIILNSYGTNNSTYIDLYGGASTTPNVRIGNLGGLFFNDSELLPQWGLYTTNGYFSGTINANQGKIGGFTIGLHSLYTGALEEDALEESTNNNIGLSTTDFSRSIGGTQRNNLRMAFGTKFGLTGDGYLYATGGNIAGWNIYADSLFKSTTQDNVEYQAYMRAYSPDQTVTTAQEAFAIRKKGTSDSSWTYPFKVTYGGKLYATEAEITGKITATSGYIGTAASGFTIDSNGFYSGSKTANTSGYISLSNANFTRTINSTSVNTLRFAIGSKFGVTNDGTLYANGANIKGINADNITAGTISIERLTALEISGRNLLKTTEAVYTPTGYAIYDIYLTEPIESGQQYILQLWDVDVSHTGKTDSTLGINVYYCGGSVTFGGWGGTDYFTNGHADYLKLTFTAYSSGTTVTSGGNMAPSPTNNALAHSSITGATSNYIRIYNSAPSVDGTKNAKIGKWKLEKGNKATDWSPAPEDVYTEIQGTNLSPFFSHTLTDVYNATTNPNGYWVKNGGYGWTSNNKFTFTRLEDGWLHVHIDNSSGTGIIRNDCCCPRYNSAIKPNTKYTFLIELRNNTSTGVDSTSNIYMVQQGGGVQFWGTNVSEGVGAKIGGVGAANTVGLTDIPANSNYTFNRSTKMSLDTTSTYYGTNIMVTYVFRANAGAVLDYDIRISMYEGIYYGPYVPYKANNANYLYYDSTNGLIISENATGQTYNSASSGFNTQLKNDGLYIRNGSNVLAQYRDDILLKSSDDVNYLLIERTGLDVYNKHNVSIFNIVSNYDFAASTDYVYQLLSNKDINNDLNGKTIRGTISFSYYINTASLKDIQYKYENGVDFLNLSSSKYTSTITLRNGEIDYEITFNSNAFSAGEETISDEDIDTITTSNIVDLRISFNRTVNSGYYNIGARKISNDGIGLYSTIIGEKNVASRSYSVAMGYNSSSTGYCSYSLGQNVSASGTYAFGTGYNTTATGYISASMGSYNTASGSHSFARGYNNIASGDYSFASGRYLNVTTKDTTAIGRFNTSPSYLKSDLLFVIGNGNSTSSRSNGTEIYKNGMIRMMGTYPALQITPTKPSTSSQDNLDRGGTIVLNTSTNSPQYAGVAMEQYQNSVRFYSLPSADGTTHTGYGKEIKFDLRAGTITGNHKLNTTGYDSASITKGSNITVTTGNIIKKNGIVQVYYEFKTTAAISAWGTVGTIPSGFRPLTNTPRVLGEEGVATTGKFFQINTSGSIFNVNALTANKTYVVWFTYIANI